MSNFQHHEKSILNLKQMTCVCTMNKDCSEQSMFLTPSQKRQCYKKRCGAICSATGRQCTNCASDSPMLHRFSSLGILKMKECCMLCTIHATQVEHEVNQITHSLSKRIIEEAANEWSKAITGGGDAYYMFENGKHADKFGRTSQLSTTPSPGTYIKTLYSNLFSTRRPSRR